MKHLLRASIILFSLAALILSCQDNPFLALIGNFNNPADPESDAFQGFPVVEDPDEITAITPPNGGTLSGTSLTVTKVDGTPAYGLRIASVKADCEAGMNLAYQKESIPSNILSIPDAPLEHGKTYYWQVQAKKADGSAWGAWSAAFSFTTDFSFLTAPPVFDLEGGYYPTDQTVTLSCPTPGAVIYYTSDGTLPTTASPRYSSQIPVSGYGTEKTIIAMAMAPGKPSSFIKKARYCIYNPSSVPVISPAGGTYNMAQTVTISTADGSTIRYTTDGTEPTTGDTLYSSSVNVTRNMTIKARSFPVIGPGSPVISAAYTLKPYTPTFSSTDSAILISCATPGATIRYTTDGTEPAETSTQYSGAIPPSSVSKALKACAWLSGWDLSETAVTSRPVPSFSISGSSSQIPVIFDASTTYDDDTLTSEIQICWDFTNDGTLDTVWSTPKITSHTFESIGTYTVKLISKDKWGLTSEIVKTVNIVDPTGTAQWARTVSSATSDSNFSSITTDGDGNVYAVGGQYGAGTFTYGPGVSVTGPYNSWYNAILVKYNSSGIVLWARTVSSIYSNSEFNSVSVDGSGNVYVVGYQHGTGTFTYGPGISAVATADSYNAVVIKYNSSGTAQWARTVTSGIGASIFRSVAVDGSGNVYVAGEQAGSGTLSYGSGVTATGAYTGTYGNWNAILVKYNSSGSAQWARTVTAGNGDSGFYSVAIDESGNIYSAGCQYGTGTTTYGPGASTSGISTGKNAILVKYSSSGSPQWARTVTAGSDSSGFYSVSVDGSGDIYVAGGQKGTGTFIYGSGISATGAYSWDNVILVKYSSSGSAQWARTVTAGNDNSLFNSVIVDKKGNVYTAGIQNGTGEFMYGSSIRATAGSVDGNAVLVKYNSAGTAQWVRTVIPGNRTSSYSCFYSIALDGNGNLYAAGSQTGTGTFTYGLGVSVGGPYTGNNAVLVKYYLEVQ